MTMGSRARFFEDVLDIRILYTNSKSQNDLTVTRTNVQLLIRITTEVWLVKSGPFSLALTKIYLKIEVVKELGISDSHIDQIEHLLVQSMNGIHLLFDNETIARILKKPTEEIDLFHMRNLDKIQDLFSQFIQKASFQEKLLFLSELDSESYEMLLRTYFHIVDNSIFTADSLRH